MILCYDSVSGRYFEITEDKLRKIVIENEFDDLNSFYEFVGLPELCYDAFRVMWGGVKVRAFFREGITEVNGKECLVFEFLRQTWI